jgi:DNA-binding GntR family transcriptional regulator
VVRTMQDPLHKKVRTALAARINSGQLRPGDRLPAERALSDEFGVARSVVRQALAGLARDGLVVSSYPRGYHVLGPRIPWLTRLRLLADEPYDVEMIDVYEAQAGPRDATALAIDVGDRVARRAYQLHGRDTHEPWANAISTHPLDDLDPDARQLLLSPDMLDNDELEHAYNRRVVGYHETVRARRAAAGEHDSLQIAATAPVLVLTRITRTTTLPIGELTLIARSDRFEVDYLTGP